MNDQQQQTVDEFLKTTVVLPSKMRSRRRWSVMRESPPLEIEITPQTNWQNIGRQLGARLIARAGQRCDCYWCSVYQHTKRGQRENYWVCVMSTAMSGDSSALVQHLNSRRALTQFDRKVLADLV
jgi:hypothetical protein